MTKKNATLDFGTHKYENCYELTLNFCPSCGEKNVWVELGGGDYYQGRWHCCTACKSVHYLDNSNNKTDEKSYLSVMNQLRCS